MQVTIEQKFEVNYCQDCPWCRDIVDTSVCFDSFDEPNYDHYCTHPKADNSTSDASKYNLGNDKYIDTSFYRNDKTEIPDWCPERG
jgi:hypothetical protein